MNSRMWIGLGGLGLVLGLAGLGYSKPKSKDEFPKALLNARYAYVEAEAGDVFNVNLIAEDRRAIADVADALRDWKRYDLTVRRSDAEILFVVRKERIASAKVGGTIGRRTVPGTAPGTTDTQTTEAGRLGAEAGPNQDMLYVYLVNPDGKKFWPLWHQFLKDGLDKPEMPLFQKFRDQVDAATKAQAAAKQSTKP